MTGGRQSEAGLQQPVRNRNSLQLERRKDTSVSRTARITQTNRLTEKQPILRRTRCGSHIFISLVTGQNENSPSRRFVGGVRFRPEEDKIAIVGNEAIMVVANQELGPYLHAAMSATGHLRTSATQRKRVSYAVRHKNC